MNKTLEIKGMMCTHCEAAVKKALEALPTVASAAVSHEKGTAELVLNADTPDGTLIKAVTDLDYEVTAVH